MSDKKPNQKEKRNAKGGGSVRQRPDGKWEARCTINGKSRSFYADKQADALKLMRDAQKAVDDQTYVEPSKLTVGQWLDIWLEEYYKPSVKPTTYIHTTKYIRLHIRPELGNYKLQQLSSIHIQRALNKFRNKNNLSPAYIKILYAKISCSLSKAKQLGFIKINPCESCTIPKSPKQEMCTLSEAEIKTFLEKLEQIKKIYRDMLKITLFTGMRRGELLGLAWNNIDFKNGTITINQQLVSEHAKKVCGKNYYISSTKNGKPRTITPAPFVMAILKETRHDQLKNQLALGQAWNNPDNLVFTNKLGHHISHTTIFENFKKVVKSIGREDMRFHDLRHTYAVMCLQEGDSPKTVQQNLGHATANFTMDVYAHVSEKMKKDSAERIQKYYEKFNA